MSHAGVLAVHSTATSLCPTAEAFWSILLYTIPNKKETSTWYNYNFICCVTDCLLKGMEFCCNQVSVGTQSFTCNLTI